MDMIGEFEPSPQGHQHALIVIDKMTNYTLYIPLQTKEADEGGHVYLVNVYSKFGRTH